MEQIEGREANGSRISAILTDLHFWVPVIVLLGGLLLLALMR